MHCKWCSLFSEPCRYVTPANLLSFSWMQSFDYFICFSFPWIEVWFRAWKLSWAGSLQVEASRWLFGTFFFLLFHFLSLTSLYLTWISWQFCLDLLGSCYAFPYIPLTFSLDTFENRFLTESKLHCWREREPGFYGCRCFKGMKGVSWGLIVGVTVGVVIGILLATVGLFCNRLRRRHPQIGNSSSRRASTVPIRTNGVDTCTALSDSTTGQESPRIPEERGISLWIEGPKRKGVISVSGIPKYAYK